MTSYTVGWPVAQFVYPTMRASDQLNWLFPTSTSHEILLHFWRNKAYLHIIDLNIH